MLVALIRKEVYRHLYPITFGVVLVAYLIYSGVTGSMSIQNGLIIAAIATVIVSYFFDRNFLETIEAMVDGARSALAVIAATAAAGIIVAVVTKTGLGLSLANSLVGLANEQLFWTLFFTMIASLILGMGAPTTANYIITSTIAAPAIILLGISDLQAHMFVFYFGIMADITPPVALGCICGSWYVRRPANRYGGHIDEAGNCGFRHPVYVRLRSRTAAGWHKQLSANGLDIRYSLPRDDCHWSWNDRGYWFRRLYWPERFVALAAGLALIYPGVWTSIAGIVVFAALIAFQYMYKESEMNQPVTS